MRRGHVIVACALALLTLGVVMVTSAGMSIDPARPATLSAMILARPFAYFTLAILALAAVSLLAPISALQRLGEPRDPAARGRSGWSVGILWVGALALIVVMALVYVPGLGTIKKGSHRWIGIPLPGTGDLSIQPSEIAKWGLVFLMAAFAVRVGSQRLGRFFSGFAPALVAVAMVAGFLAMEDLGTAILLAGVAVTVLVAAGARAWQFALLLPVPLIGLIAAVVNHPYRLDRIRTFLDPYGDPDGKGYHMIQSMIAVANGDITGRGLGHGLQKFGYLPEDTTDFIYAIICEELGVPGAFLVAALYVILLWAGLAVVRSQRSAFLKLIALGITTTVAFQALINLAVVTALGPTKGIALPLLSSGGTGWVLTGSALGILVAIDRASRRVPDVASSTLEGSHDQVGISGSPTAVPA